MHGFSKVNILRHGIEDVWYWFWDGASRIWEIDKRSITSIIVYTSKSPSEMHKGEMVEALRINLSSKSLVQIPIHGDKVVFFYKQNCMLWTLLTHTGYPTLCQQIQLIIANCKHSIPICKISISLGEQSK